MLKIAICDDDVPLCSQLEEIVKTHCISIAIEFEIVPFYQGEELLKSLITGKHYDLIFLDIEINTMTGIEVGNTIRNKLDDHITKIVFITSKQGYEQALFDVQPLNFIKKPLDVGKVKHCINLALKITQTEALFFEYKIGQQIHKVKLANILYFEAQRKKVKMVTQTEMILFYGTLSEILDKLPKNFLQVHQSYVVNIHLSTKITSDTLTVTNNDQIPISRRNISKVRQFLAFSVMEKQNELL